MLLNVPQDYKLETFGGTPTRPGMRNRHRKEDPQGTVCGKLGLRPGPNGS